MSMIDDYFAGLSGWQAERTAQLRRDILATGGITEGFKWGHPVYEASGPVCLIKAHKAHIAFGFFRGAQMLDIEPRLAPNGSFEMATIRVEADDEITRAQIRRLVTAAVALNQQHGSPLQGAKA